MRGHVRQRGSTWTWYINLPADVSGKRRQDSKGGFRTKREAQRALGEAIHALEHGSYVAPSTKRLGEYLLGWLEVQRAHLKRSTLASYRSKIITHVIPRVGAVGLQQLTAGTLNRLYAELLASGGRGGGPLSVRSVEYVHAILRKALGDAFKTDLVAVNVALKATPPRRRDTAQSTSVPAGEPPPAWNAQQVRRFVDAAGADRLRAAYVVAVNNGLRRGEVLGLRWSDVDLTEGRLSVCQSLGVINHELDFTTTKTRNSRRSFYVDAVTVEALREHRELQNEDRLAWGAAWRDERGLVFTREDGSPVHPNWMIRQFARSARAAGLPPIRFHDLRHTYATLALQAGVPIKVVSTRLGHANIGITLNTYSHVLADDDQEAARLFHRHVYGAVSSRRGPSCGPALTIG